MVGNVAETQSQDLISSIELCLARGYVAPSLMLIYATMDIMAWLDRDEGHMDVQRGDFVKWVEKYVLPGSGLSCTATDLYAARCSLIHSYSAESRLSREGQANETYYAWGTADEGDLQRRIDLAGSRNARAVHVEELLGALKQGVASFIADASQSRLIEDRAQKLFANMPQG